MEPGGQHIGEAGALDARLGSYPLDGADEEMCDKPLAKLEPLLFGRVSRVFVGLVSLGLVAFVPLDGFGILGAAALAVLGISFLVGGIVGNPGCEVTALPNLFLPSDKKVHCI